MKFSPEDIFAASVAVALHLVLGALAWFGLPDFLPTEKAEVIPVQAVFLDESRSRLAAQRAEEEARRRATEEARRKAEAERLRKEEEARRQAEEEARRKAAEEARRKAEEEARRKAEEEARRKAQEEARRKAEEEARRKAEEARRKEAERRRRQEESERRLKEALAAEEEAIRAAEQAKAQAAQDASDRAEYVSMLARYIQRNWTRPPGIDEDFSCRIRIRQLPGGQIQQYELLESCGNTFLDASVENAIRKSDPLPLPDNPRVFERTLTLIFKP